MDNDSNITPQTAQTPAPAPAPAPTQNSAKTPKPVVTPLPGVPLALASANTAVIAAGAVAAAPVIAGLAVAGGTVAAAAVASVRKRSARKASNAGSRAALRSAKSPHRTSTGLTRSPSAGGGKQSSTGGTKAGSGGKRHAPTSLGSVGTGAKHKPAKSPAKLSTSAGGALPKQRSGGPSLAKGGTKSPAKPTTHAPSKGGAGQSRTGKTNGAAGGGQRTAPKNPGLLGKFGTAAKANKAARAERKASKAAGAGKASPSSTTGGSTATAYDASGKPLSRNKAIRAGQKKWRKHAAGRQAMAAKVRNVPRQARQLATAGLLAGLAGATVGALTVFSKKPHGKNVARRVWAVRRRRQAAANATRTPKATKERISPESLSAKSVNDPQKPTSDRLDIHRPGDAASALGLKKTSPGTTFAPAGATNASARPIPAGASTMSTFSMHDAAAEFAAAAAGYAVDPDENGAMMQVRADLGLLPEAENHLAEGLRIWLAKLNEGFAVDPAVIDAMHRVYEAKLAAAQAATEVIAVFEKVHEQDIAKHEAPRAGEKGWNV